MKLASQKECTGCMACVDACPHKVLKAEMDLNGYYAIVPDCMEKCVECGRCSRVCPILNPAQTTGKSTPYAAWNLDAEQRKQSASGGIFASLATSIIRKGGSVYGAAIDGFEIKHLRITDEHELHRLHSIRLIPFVGDFRPCCPCCICKHPVSIRAYSRSGTKKTVGKAKASNMP